MQWSRSSFGQMTAAPTSWLPSQHMACGMLTCLVMSMMGSHVSTATFGNRLILMSCHLPCIPQRAQQNPRERGGVLGPSSEFYNELPCLETLPCTYLVSCQPTPIFSAPMSTSSLLYAARKLKYLHFCFSRLMQAAFSWLHFPEQNQASRCER